MKYIFSIILINFGFLTSYAQSCLPSGITFTTQAQIDASPNNYPGCTQVLGYVNLVYSDITDLSPLSQLTTINGFLNLAYTNLTSLNGLQNLQEIGSLTVQNNDLLTTLLPLNPTSLRSISVSANASLNSIELNSTSNNLGEIHVSSNPVLTSFQMNNISSINGTYAQFLIINNPMLNQIDLNNINDINLWQFKIENSGLISLDFLNGVSGTIDYLIISDNSNLSSFGNISANITETIWFTNNDLLLNLPELNNNIQLTNELNLSDNYLLTSLTGLESITSLANLVINDNPSLNSLAGLNNIVNMTGPLISIENNPQLQNLNSLSSNLNSNFSEIRIKNNALLTSISSLHNVNNSGYFGGIEIEMNPLLNSLEGIYSSTSPFIENYGNFIIVNNGALTSLSGLDSVYHYGIVEIQNNINLGECEIWGICSLIDDCGNSCFNISNNALNCNSFIAIQTACDALLPITLSSFNVKNKANNNLLHWQTSSEINSHYFEIEYSTDGSDFITIGRNEGAGNSNTLLDYYFVHKNLESGMHYYRLKQVDYDGQYSYSEIRSVVMKGEGNEVSIYPNPTSEFISILGMTNGRYEIRDFSGKIVRSDDFISSVLSLEGLSAGIYFVSLTNNDLNGVFKVHKL